jgi:hypothetical protein
MSRFRGLLSGLILLAPTAVFGQVVQETTTTVPVAGTTPIRRVTQLIGSNVALQGVNNFGRIDDVILNDNGGIGYLVVSNGGRYAMLPWNAANVNYGQRLVTYNVTPQAIQPLFFAPNAWPNISDQTFTTRMTRVFPNTGTVRREVLRPVEGTTPVTAPPVVEKQKVKVKNNGEVKIKEKVK